MVEKYSDDGFLYDVQYEMAIGSKAMSSFVFGEDYSEEVVEDLLKNAPYNINVLDVRYRGYVLKMKSFD